MPELRFPSASRTTQDQLMDVTHGANDETRHRVMELGNGNKIHLVADGMHGFWALHLDKGQLPAWMQGKYTSISEAEKAISRWVKERELTVEESKPAELKKVK